MRKGMVGVLVGLLMMGMVGGAWVGLASSSDGQQQKKTKPGPPETPTALVLDQYGSSIVFPMFGNVYPTGFYYVQINVGQPPNPYFLDPDTGSDLTWLQCDAPCVRCTKQPHPLYRPKNELVACKDPLCTSLHWPGEHNCENPEQCDYEIQYADGGSSLGVLVRDLFPLNLTNGVRLSPRLALGCGYDQIPGASFHPLDGILGLGNGKSSIISQLHSQGVVRNVIGHCLSGRGGGYLFFGDDIYDSSRIVWTKMSRDFSYYSPGNAELILGGKASGFKNLRVVFDSGSSYTYFNSEAYQAVLSLTRKELSKTPLNEAQDDRTLPFCWKGKKPFKNMRDIKRYFKPFALSFENRGKAKTKYELLPESYLIISSKGNVCLGILNGTEIGLQNFNVIGDISMQDRMVIYDNEKQVIGWAPTKCDRIPKPRSDD
ncbi:aspartic proteinase Asp1 [Malania oleifera]|uniref:aspartic proteinase Asp1 n=1 Tax=Malania oleifera TaxID=397392 RepID=UPI0025AE9297|nr:aspartic proteinase Asp1 [Malania oleifera]